TEDGFEMQLGTNHFGHFALTGLLLPALLETPDARVVSVSSTAHRFGRMNFADLQGERFYARWPAYGQSKLANLLFAFELARKLARAGHAMQSVACHPGIAATNLQAVGFRMDGADLLARVADVGTRLFAQDAAMGALPTLYAATALDVENGDYLGPDGPFEATGHPTWVGTSRAARDRAGAKKLWQRSESLTGVRFEL
ncbi:MAG: SDR family NAD(P)-dependent oxidoreductase, partial [Myxococcota bacterium]